ncbi:dsDNA nuclease domain-containing protein [Streptomyces sp. NPDC058286]|uniref:dsDNA nuclease domain-containing protein n=1 Tax=Streptomyces sp. NPDC058286 TaxID=3346422 RepID=UPI0036EC64A1
MTLAPADGGRRSRRGFLYQDAVTLLDCLDMLDGLWTSVSWEDEEDILCHRGDAPAYRQVKTVEGANKGHSIADVCRADPSKKPENRTAATSYLGKLFLGKELPDGARFTLIVNRTPAATLYPFVCARGAEPQPVAGSSRDEVIERLGDLELPDGRDVSWCVERLDVLITARTVDQVEREAFQRLHPLIRDYLGQEPLVPEVDNVLQQLISVYIGRGATEPVPRRHSTDDFRRVLEDSIRQATGRRRDGTTERLTTLQEKLRPAGVPEAEAERQHESLLAFRQTRRRSVGLSAQRLDALSDKVYAICQITSMRRRSGLIEAGQAAYAATVEAILAMPEVASGDVAVSDALAVLSDITARCQNRYEDAS